jgi:CRISPR-associated protein Cmr2
MRVVCEECGPDAILFPRLRGVPQADLWLRDECGLAEDLFEDCAWTRKGTDANPLFAAALPNRFTAIVPASKVRGIGEKITRAVQEWVVEKADAGFKLLLAEAGDIKDDPSLPAYAQIREQLAGFPEVHWVGVPWSLVKTDDGGKVEASDRTLAEAMQPFFDSEEPGFLGSPAWELLSRGVQLEEGWFWKPNPGSLYPALHELLERALSAAKATREFGQIRQAGWRCSLTGESEWLTTDRAQLASPPGHRKDTLWTRVGQSRKAWVKKGEHLGALATLKRLWPTLFIEELRDLVGDMQRFVVSTHTMALAGSLANWMDKDEALPAALADELANVSNRVALPPRLARNAHGDGEHYRLVRNIPGWFEAARESDDEGKANRAESMLKKLFGHKPEAYYALILMDGDEMGAWLSAADGKTRPHQDSYHPQVRAGLGNRFSYDENFLRYALANRAPNPAWHMAISEALNHFALTLAPAIVHDHFNGRVLYAGGDDLLAMLPVSELLPAMAALRAAYTGIEPRMVGAQDDDVGFRSHANGFVRHGKRVLRVMGEEATASIGAVIAHHKTPLNLVLRELRAAEQRAKIEGGRNAFSITVLKRSGGAQRLTSKWYRDDGDSPMTCLRELAAAISADQSRRTAYNTQQWIVDLPGPQSVGGEKGWRVMVAQLLAAQFRRQGLGDADAHARRLAELAPLVAGHSGDDLQRALDHISQFLAVAEFLAREGRSSGESA